MHVQVVTYQLWGMSEQEYLGVAHRLAPRFAAIPGLQAKLWLDHAQPGRYGAVYLWDDREAMERFKASDLFEPGNPNFSDVTSASFDVLENLSRLTQPVRELVEARGGVGTPSSRRGDTEEEGPVAAVKDAARTAARTATAAASRATKAASSTAARATKAASSTAAKATEPAATKGTPRSRPAVKKTAKKTATKTRPASRTTKSS